MFYRILYCSRNRIEGSPAQIDAEIASILQKSRSNNEAADVTGALLFNGEAFAQVLEGPRDAVDIAFAKIRFDSRHSDVVVLEEAYQPERHFSNWSMAYADGNAFNALADAELDIEHVYRDPKGFAPRILQWLRDIVSAHR